MMMTMMNGPDCKLQLAKHVSGLSFSAASALPLSKNDFSFTRKSGIAPLRASKDSPAGKPKGEKGNDIPATMAKIQTLMYEKLFDMVKDIQFLYLNDKWGWLMKAWGDTLIVVYVVVLALLTVMNWFIGNKEKVADKEKE